MTAKSFKRILASAAVFTVVVMSFALFASADIQVNQVDIYASNIRFRAWGSNWTGKVADVSSSGRNLSVSVSSYVTSRIDFSLSSPLSSYLPDETEYYYFEFHCNYSAETYLPSNSNRFPFLGFSWISFYSSSDASSGNLASIDVSDSALTVYYGFEDGEDYRIVNEADFIRYLSQTSDYGVTYSFYVVVSRSWFEAYADIVPSVRSISLFFNRSTDTGSYVYIQPFIRLYSGVEIVGIETISDQINGLSDQVSDLIHGDSSMQDQYGDLSSDDSALNSDIDSILNDFKNQVGGDLNDGLSDILPNITNFSGDFLPQLWACMFQNSDGVNPEPGGTYLFQFACVGLFSTVMFFILRV